MSSRLQLDISNLSLGRRHLVNAYEVEAGIGVIAGNTVWSMPECLECEVPQKACYINTLTYLPTYLTLNNRDPKRSLKVIQIGTIQKLGCSFLFAFRSNYGHIFNRLWDIQRQITRKWYKIEL